MSLFVKICGITSTDAASAAVDAGANALGFVFADSPRQITPSLATDLARDLPRHVEKVAVFRRPHRNEIESVLAGFDADTVQADWSSLVGFDDRPVLPVLRDLDCPDCDGQRILFEGVRSGVGERADWSMANQLARRSRLVLAGGLSTGNVGEAIAAVHPFGVDVSTGVESSPGLKDPRLIASFTKEVRRIEKEMVNI